MFVRKSLFELEYFNPRWRKKCEYVLRPTTDNPSVTPDIKQSKADAHTLLDDDDDDDDDYDDGMDGATQPASQLLQKRTQGVNYVYN